MTDRTPKLLVDALGAIESAQEFVAGCSLADYTANKMRRSAVERQLEILGEACARMTRLEPLLLASVANLKLAIDLRMRRESIAARYATWRLRNADRRGGKGMRKRKRDRTTSPVLPLLPLGEGGDEGQRSSNASKHLLPGRQNHLQISTGSNSQSPHPSLLPEGEGGIQKTPSALLPLAPCLIPHPSWLGL